MNAKMIEGLIAIRNGIDLILESENKVANVSAEKKVTPKKVEVEQEVEEVKQEEAPVVTGTIDKAQLDAMTYNDLKKFAKEIGVSAVGARAKLTQTILDAGVSAPVEEVEEEEEKEVKKAITSPPQVRGKKAKPVEEEVEDEEDEEDPIVAQVNEAVEDMTTEEIADFLTESGISAKGKRQALIAKVVKAVKDGIIDLGDDDEEDEDEEADQGVVEDFDEEAYQMVNDPSNPDMTKERKSAIKAFAKTTKADIKSGDITREDMVEFLQDFFETDDDMKQWKDSDISNEYIDAGSRLIDDEGEISEEGAYLVNGVPYCCARPLVHDEENGVYNCAHCNEEYELEE